MGECEFLDQCPFYKDELENKPETADEMKEKYCKSNNLNCALYMIMNSIGREYLMPDLYPDEKIRAYGLIAEKS